MSDNRVLSDINGKMSDLRKPETELVAVPDVMSYVKRARSDSTWSAYASDLACFAEFCDRVGESMLPATPETVARYLVSLHVEKGRKPATLGRRLAAISVRHKGAGLVTPTSSELVLSTLAGIKREAGTAQNRKEPVRLRHLRAALQDWRDDEIGVRNRAMILLGYAGGFRRSELAALDTDDVKRCDEGLIVTVRRSKTDQEGKGQTKAIPYGSNPATCPVRAVAAWIGMLEDAGPLFRPVQKGGKIGGGRINDKTVARVVKDLAESVGLDASAVGAHSLRAGLVTDAFAAGVAEAVVMDQTGHRSSEVLRVYRREADQFRHNAASAVGL